MRLLLSLCKTHVSLSNLTVLNMFSSVAVWISSMADECKWSPLKGCSRCLVVTPCDYTGIFKSRCLFFTWLYLGEMNTSAEDVIHVLLLNFVRTLTEY